jgi:hypothetical protein
MPWNDRRIAAALFIGAWLTYGFIGPGGDTRNPNAVSRMALIYSLLEQHTLTIDRFAPLTVDKAFVDGSYFLDKAPGLSLMALPWVAGYLFVGGALGLDTAPIAAGGLTSSYDYSAVIACFFTSALFGGAAVAAVFLTARCWTGVGAALFASLVFAAATPAAGWATEFFGHAVAGACLLLAFAVMVRVPVPQRRDAGVWAAALGVGLLLGWTVVVEYTAGVAGAVLAGFGLGKIMRWQPGMRGGAIAAAGAGVFVTVLVLAVYNTAAFGSPIHIGYGDVVGFGGMKHGLMGVSWPSPSVLYKILLGRYRGIVWVSPLMLVAPLAFVAAFRRLQQPEAWVLLLVPAAYLAINGGYVYWEGGWSTGPRFLVPALGFVCLAFAPLWESAGPRSRVVLLFAAAFSAALSLICAVTSMTAPNEIADPLFDYILPRFGRAQVHDMLNLFGRHGLGTLLVLPLIWLLAAGFSRWIPGLRRR